MAQTAVEWLIENLGLLEAPDKIIKQAIKMEKNQIVNAVTFGNRQDCYDASETLGGKYYNETYKK